jgi:hypothetical protein
MTPVVFLAQKPAYGLNCVHLGYIYYFHIYKLSQRGTQRSQMHSQHIS